MADGKSERSRKEGAREAIGANLRRSILKRRAVQLARPLDKPDIPPGNQYVMFEIAKQRFALDIKYTDEVFQLKALLPVPGTPAYVVGIVSLRGVLTTVVDLSYLFNLHGRSVMASDRALIAKRDKFQVALLTDDVLGLEFIADDDIQESPALVSNIPEQYVSGVIEDSTIVIRCDHLLSAEALEVNQ